MLKYSSLLALVIILIAGIYTSCITIENQYSGIPPGPWRGVIQIEPKFITPNKKGQPLPEKMNIAFEEVNDGELPFQFEVIYKNETDFYIEIQNGDERIKVDDIIIGHDRTNGDDTIMINFPVYDTYIKGKYEEGLIDGDWYVNYKEGYSIPFTARFGKNHRFTNLSKTPEYDISGKWEVLFNANSPYPAIGEFQQKGNRLTGTFLTETGDYRFLEGSVQGNKLYLSCFDGSHAFLFEGKIMDKDNIVGTFRSGKHYKTTWDAKRNPDFTLTSADSLTYLNEGYDKLAFSFKNTDGKTISLADERYQGKPKLVQILGTWCPNCRDETEFLVNYLKNNPNTDLEIIAIAFERYKDESKSMDALKRYKEKFGMNYEMVLGGYFNKKEAAAQLPMLNHVLSYPTLIFIDQNDNIQRIHTGFSGPATSEYEEFVSSFEQSIKKLLSN